MKPYQRLAQAAAPDGTVLTLYHHDGAYVLRVNGLELMSTRRSNSEEQLATLACTPLLGLAEPQVLIGGLGFGFTLKAALLALPPSARVVVAELVQEVIDWNREPAWTLAGSALLDTRVTLRHADVRRVMRDSPGAFDAILLDVDNGAAPLTTSSNASLYSNAGIELAVSALRPGGRLAYWSAAPDPRFEKALRRAKLAVEAHRVRAHTSSGGYCTLLIATLRATAIGRILDVTKPF